MLPIVRVSDGDMIVVHLGGRDQRIRHIGIDTPETVRAGTAVQRYGSEGRRG